MIFRSWLITLFPTEEPRIFSVLMLPRLRTKAVQGVRVAGTADIRFLGPECLRPILSVEIGEMAVLSDGAIRAAIKRVQFTGREEILRDGEGRGTGRLLLFLRPRTKRLTTYWCAAQHRGKRKVQIKLGDYPSMGLAEAREVFQRDY